MTDSTHSEASWIVAADEDGSRLDHFLARRAGLSHGAARRLVEERTVRVNGRRAAKGLKLRAGDRVSVNVPVLAGPYAMNPDDAVRAATDPAPLPQPELPLDVLYEDAFLIALNKPAGMPSHPLRPLERGTLAAALIARFPECAAASIDPREAGLAHRLDVDTSGVIVAARSRADWDWLRAAFRAHRVRKTYLALVGGIIDEPGVIERAIAHAPGDASRAIAVDDPFEAARLSALPARSEYRPLRSGLGRTLLLVRTSTGRMHQVRVHLAAAGHPLVGDALYGGAAALPGTRGHLLHARSLELPTPSGTALCLFAPLPPDRRAALLEEHLLADGYEADWG